MIQCAVLNQWGYADVNPQPGFMFGKDGSLRQAMSCEKGGLAGLHLRTPISPDMGDQVAIR
jgi:hypothetical protein